MAIRARRGRQRRFRFVRHRLHWAARSGVRRRAAAPSSAPGPADDGASCVSVPSGIVRGRRFFSTSVPPIRVMRTLSSADRPCAEFPPRSPAARRATRAASPSLARRRRKRSRSLSTYGPPSARARRGDRQMKRWCEAHDTRSTRGQSWAGRRAPIVSGGGGTTRTLAGSVLDDKIHYTRSARRACARRGGCRPHAAARPPCESHDSRRSSRC